VNSSGKVTFKKPGWTLIGVASVDNPSSFVRFGVTVRANQRIWPAPIPADYAGSKEALYVLPNGLYYSGAKMMAEVYLYNHTGNPIKTLPPFYAAVADPGGDHALFVKAVAGSTFRSPIMPEGIGVYKLSTSYKKVDLYLYPEYSPMLLFQ
jgi:hypothetical protein